MNWLEKKTLALFVKTKGHLSNPLLSGMGSVFCLHRVLPKGTPHGLFNPLSLSISCDGLEEIIRYFKKHEYDFISMDEVYERLSAKNYVKKKFVAFTIDDGYWDNYTHAFPLFKTYDVPFTVYVTSSFPDKSLGLWWYDLEDFLLNSNTVIRPDSFEPVDITSHEKKIAAFFSWRKHIIEATDSRDLHSRLQKLPNLSQYSRLSNAAKPMTWEQIKEISEHPLGNIGAHTVHHLALKKMEYRDALAEISTSKKEIEKRIGKAVCHFAYPFGSNNECGEREFKMAQDAGFKTSVTLRQGNIFIQNAKSLQALPRIPLGDHFNTDKLDFVRNGIHHYSYNGFKKI